MFRSRSLPVGLALVAACSLSACGSDEKTAASAGATTPVVTKDRIPPTGAGVAASPTDQVRGLVPGAVGDTYDVQLANLRAAWHAEPKLTWSAVKVGDANWIATLVMRGPARQTLAARWRVLLPLDRAPTADELKAEPDDVIRPLNATARRLATYPAAFPAAGDVRVSAWALRGVGEAGDQVDISSPDGAAPILVDGKIDQAALRAAHILAGATPRESLSTSGAHFEDEHGKPLTTSEFGNRVLEAGGLPVIVTWRNIAPGTTSAQLWKRTPATIQIPHLTKPTPTANP